VKIDEDLAAVAAFTEAEQFADIRRHVDPEWVREALEATGTATVRRRRLPAEQVVWLVIGMAMFRKVADPRLGRPLESRTARTQGDGGPEHGGRRQAHAK